MSGFERQDLVRIVRLINGYTFVQDAQNQRAPREGDTAILTEIYAGKRLGYALECRDGRGEIVWRMRFDAREIELALVKKATP